MRKSEVNPQISLDNGNTRLSFTEYGDQKGMPIFGLHGTPGSSLQFSTFNAAAKEVGVRLIALDRPGYGRSDFDSSHCINTLADRIGFLASALNLDRFGVIGIAGGGPYALACAHKFDQKLSGVSIVCSCAPMDRSESLDDMLPGERMMFRLSYQHPTLAGLALRVSQIVVRFLGKDGLQLLTKNLPTPDREMFKRDEYRTLVYQENTTASKMHNQAAVQDFALFTLPWGFDLKDIKIPVHIFHGELDSNTPIDHGRRIASQLQSGIMRDYPQHGHLSILDEAKAILIAAAGLTKC